jgi:hypothetical protein
MTSGDGSQTHHRASAPFSASRFSGPSHPPIVAFRSSAVEREEGQMSGLERVTDRLEDAVSVVGRAVELAFLAVFFVALLCVIAVMVAGTYGMLHKGDDFDFGGGSGGGGDVIVLNGLL